MAQQAAHMHPSLHAGPAFPSSAQVSWEVLSLVEGGQQGGAYHIVAAQLLA
jgi:hypothetical protein